MTQLPSSHVLLGPKKCIFFSVLLKYMQKKSLAEKVHKTLFRAVR